MDTLLEWVWTPLLDPARLGLGLALVVALALCATAALWPAKAPGEATPAERRRLAAGRGSAEALFVTLVRLTPAALVVGAAGLLAPVAPPHTLLLSSRARLAD